MKLKKIASLMLAGVMAVSMLAGCSTTSVKPEDPTTPEEPTVTGYSSVLANELSTISNSKIALSDSNDLNAALTKAMGYAGNDTITNEFLKDMKDGSVVYVRPQSGGAMGLAANSLVSTLKAENTSSCYTATDAVNVLNPALWNRTDDNMSVVMLFVVDSKVTVEAAMDQVANKIDSAIKNLALDDDEIEADPSQIRYTYTGSVSAYSKTYTEGHGMGLTFIAVQLNRTI